MTIYQLMYADDLIFFYEAILGEASNMMDIVKRYSKALGQALKFEKRGGYFSKNVHVIY